ncbi:hypothetical protein DEJ28_08970 [Curtobacterium sp. MCPF17_002]|uniref:hypothetical protein n=1 Tax=Curtobacterium sp. MCPF17_002 TaxID=2175645 RepID=UPI000DA92797|nr:hypothetical protein [Curtobacterium sp. MCPF17_002]WIB79212.1 hypothetical protein DEJ28_08970 [Curtobacterium sp. MCPF17_002]
MTTNRTLALVGGIFAAFGGALSGSGYLILTISAAVGGSFPFGAAFMVFGGAPFALVGATLLAIAWFEGRPPRARQP